MTASHLDLFTDSAQSLGYGATLGRAWFAGEWPPSWKQFEITLLELYPIVAAMHVWGQRLSNQRVILHTDNQALVHIINKLTSKDHKIMVLIRHFTLVSMQNNILFRAEHIPGVQNTLADALSRFNFQEFHVQAPWADQDPTEIPPEFPTQQLVVGLEHVIQAALSNNTHKLYQRAWSTLMDFGNNSGFTVFPLDQLYLVCSSHTFKVGVTLQRRSGQ